MILLVIFIQSAESRFVEQEVVDKLQTQEWVSVGITVEENTSTAEILSKLGDNFILEDKDPFRDRWVKGKINNVGFNLIKDDNHLKGIFLPKTYSTGPAIEIKKENNTKMPKNLLFALLLFVFYILWKKFYKKR